MSQRSSPKKVLVLGSAGTIGSVLCKHIEQNGDEVIKWDVKDFDYQDLSKDFCKHYLKLEMEKADFVYFLAFDVGGSKYLKMKQNNYSFILNNMKIMTNVFDCLWELKKPFIFASSMMAGMSWSSYGRLKLLGEELTDTFWEGVSVRFWNVYGYESYGEKSHVITDFAYQALNKKQINMITNGEEVRQFVHVDDACRALESLRHNWNNKYGLADTLDSVIDISSGTWIKIKDVANIVSKYTNNASVMSGEFKDKVQREQSVEPNLKRIQKEPFNWKPEIDLETGIRDLINHIKILR